VTNSRPNKDNAFLETKDGVKLLSPKQTFSTEKFRQLAPEPLLSSRIWGKKARRRDGGFLEQHARFVNEEIKVIAWEGRGAANIPRIDSEPT